jgi:hypothetical protein
MALQVFNSDSIGPGIQANLGTDDLFVKAGVLLASTDGSSTISANGVGNILHIDGQVISDGLCLDLGFPDIGPQQINTYLGASSVVRSYGGTAIALFGADHTIEMQGKVFAEGLGLSLIGGDGSESFITNDGLISAGHTGVLVDTADYTTIENSGKIDGDVAGIWIQGTSGGIRIVNSGTIKGEQGIVNVSDSGIVIENSGLIRLGAQLGNEDDTYDGRFGRITGDLLAGTGDDTIKGGASDERFQGEAGRDLISGGGGADMFIYNVAGDSTLDSAGRDLITDFSHKSRDIIDFSNLIGGELDFVGKSHFSGADEIRFQIIGKSTFVYVNLDTDSEAEMAIQCSGKIKFVQSDFAI